MGGDRLHGRFERDRRRLEGAVGPHQRAGVAGLGRQAPGAERRGQEPGRQELSVADDAVDPGFPRPLPGDPGALAVAEFPGQAVAQFVDGRVEGSQVGRGGDLGRDLQVAVAKRGGLARRVSAAVAPQGVPGQRQEAIRDAAEG